MKRFSKFIILFIFMFVLFTLTSCNNTKKYTIKWQNDDGNILKVETNISDGNIPDFVGDYPTKVKTPKYTYTFTGWSKEVNEETGEIIFTAIFETCINKYNVTFLNEDGTTLKEAKEYEYGTLPENIEVPEIPAKTGNAALSYPNPTWDKEIVEVTEDVVYKAKYTPVVNKYNVTFVDEDGTTILKGTKAYDYGTLASDIEVPETPTKQSTPEFNYEFAGWNKTIEPVTTDVIYKATYKEAINKYSVTFVDEDGTTVLKEAKTYDYGTLASKIEVPSTPTKARTQAYTYEFAGWDKQISDVTENVIYKATYKETLNKYNVTFVDEFGTNILKETKAYDYGTKANDIEVPETPTKAKTKAYTYEFAGWDKEIEDVTADVVYKATFKKTINKYSVTFVDEDGTTVLKEATLYDYGTFVSDIVQPTTPTKQRTAEFNYEFAGWDKAIENVTTDVVYKATYKEAINKYNVTFVDEDGTTVLKEAKLYDYGTSVANIELPANPTKGRTQAYTYKFDGWDKAIVDVTEDVVYIATYKGTLNKYNVTFVDEDGTTVLKETQSYDYGTLATDIVKPDDPTKGRTQAYTYEFNGWDNEVADVTEDVTYIATYKGTLNKYNVTFVDEDGITVLKETKSYDYGTLASDIVLPVNPIKARTQVYTYEFNGWDQAIVAVTEDVTYTATYSSTINKYNVTFVDEDGTTVLKEAQAYDYGTLASNIELPTNPTKARTQAYTYEFAGWDNEVANVTEDVTYTATYSGTLNKYNVTFVDEDGTTVLKEAQAYDYGTLAADIELPVNPTKARTQAYTYEFNGWNNEVADVTEDVTYTATYKETLNKYNVTFVDEDGTTVLKETKAYGYGTKSSEIEQPITPTKSKTIKYTYEFNGWNNEVSEVVDDIVYVATYTATINKYSITLDCDVYSTGEIANKVDVEFDSMYQLPVPKSTSSLKTFAGWYSDYNGLGEKYTGEDGNSLDKYRDTGDIELYALWVDVFEFVEIDDGAAYSIKQGSGSNLLTEITIPASYLEKPVTALENGAFKDCSKIEKVIIPDSVTVIGDEAFRNCKMLKTIALPAGLQELVESEESETITRVHSFDFCTLLEAITISAENTNYKTINGVLYKCEKDNNGEYLGLTLLKCPQVQQGVINIAEDVIKVEKYAFYEINTVTKVVFQNFEKEVVFDENAFYYCRSIEEIVLPKGLKDMPNGMIYYCPKLTSINIPNTVEYMSGIALDSCYKISEVLFEEGGTNSLVIGGGSIGYGTNTRTYKGMFYNNKVIKNLILPERTTRIGDYAFASYASYTSSITGPVDYSCSLETVVIPSTVTSIGKYAFYGCSIKNLTFAEGTDDLIIAEAAFYKLQVKTLVLPSNLFSLGSSTFGNSNTLESVTFPEGLETIGESAFNNCTKLKDVNISDSIRTIGKNAFDNCKALENVNFTEYSRLNTISVTAFRNCTSIKTISIPQTVEKIDNMAFEGCGSLENVVWVGSDTEEGASLNTLGYQVFKSTALKEFSFPYCGKDSSGKINKITIPTGNTVNMFEACKHLTTVHLSASVSSIDKMFAKCSSIKNVIIDPANENFSMAEGKPIILGFDGKSIELIFGKIDSIVIPDGITEIGSYAFSGQTDIESIVLPKTLKKIGTYAFNNCVGLKSVTFETGSVIDTIDTYAFNGCTSLESITLPDTITTIANYTFCSCAGLKSVKLPKNLTTIGQYAFAHNLSLESIDFPDSLTKIDQYAFLDTGLKEVVITKNIKTIGIYAFQKNYTLEKITINSTQITSANQWFNYCPNLKEVVFADGITTLGGYMFQYDTSLESVVLPAGLKELPTSLFDGCTSLKSIVIPASVTKIGTYVFRNCTSLESVTFEEGSELTTIDAYVFNGCESLKSIELPTTLTTLGNYAFMASGIESIVIPNGVTKLGTVAATGHVFQNCKSLKTVVLPEQLKFLYGYVFDGCETLESLTIPANITALGNNVASNCLNLKTVSILGTVTTYGSYIFANDTALTDVSIEATNTKTGTYMFQNCTALESIVLPTSLAATGLTTNIFDGCTSLKSIEIPSKVTTISAYCFRNCTSLETVTFKGSVTNINTSAFENCVALKAIDAANVKTTGTASFKGCTSLIEFHSTVLTTVGIECFQYTSLKSFFIPKTVTTFNGGALNTLTNIEVTCDPAARYQVYENMAVVDTKSGTTFGTLKTVFNIAIGAEVVIPDTVLKFETYAFENTVNLKKVTIPETITAITNYCFRGCSSLEVVELPSTLKTFGSESFAGTALKEVIIPEGVTTLSNAFMNIPTLEKVFIPKTVTSVGATFQNCTALVDVEIEDGIVTLGTKMFMGCTALETIVIPGSVGEKITSTSMATNLFTDCTSLKNVTLGEGIKFLPYYTFQNCTALENVVLPESLYSIGNYAFSNTGIKELVLPETITNLGSYVFAYNEQLVSVSIPASLIAGTYAFMDCPLLENVTFAEGFRFSNAAGTSSMGSEMFTDCVSLKKVVLPSTALYIPNNCFKNCTGLEEVVLNEGLTKIESYAFRDCTNLSKINIPSTVTYIAYGAFARCTSIKSMYIPLECQIQVTSGVVNTPWDEWTSEQKVYVEGTLFDITDFWGEVNSSIGFFRYYTNNNAIFIFGYVPEE